MKQNLVGSEKSVNFPYNKILLPNLLLSWLDFHGYGHFLA